MEKYLEQLIEDIREATKEAPVPGELWSSVNMDDPGEVEDMAYVEQFFYGTPQKLSAIVGIEKIQLPPLEKLKTLPGSQILARLVMEMGVLLKAYHFVPDFPEGLPIEVKYELLREIWDSEEVYVGAGEVHIEFCNYYPDACPFPQEYCECRKLAEEEDGFLDDEPEERDDGSLPF